MSALISKFADLSIPNDAGSVRDSGGVSVEYTAETYKTALKRLDADLINRTECGCNDGDFIKVFNSYIDEIRGNIV